MPEISVIIPAYNREASVEAAIRSALGQSFRDLEVILVDDCSADKTGEIAQRLALMDPRLKVIRHDHNKGAGAARNTGISAAQGEWIALLDSDDLWLERKIEKQRTHTQADIVLCDALFRDGKGHDRLRRLPRDPQWDDLVVQGHGFNMGSAMLIRKSLFEQTGLLDESLTRLEDWDWCLRAIRTGAGIETVPEALCIIRVGAPPAVQAVIDSARHLWENHHPHLGAHDLRVFEASLALEIATAQLWHKNGLGFVQGWLDALRLQPERALGFLAARVKRVLSGDAPRLFGLFAP